MALSISRPLPVWWPQWHFHSCGAVADRSVAQSARRRLLAYLYRFLLLLVLWRLTPVIRIAGSTGLPVLLLAQLGIPRTPTVLYCGARSHLLQTSFR
jgi:hypothetical protein